jgi:hypothetical protein
MVQSRTLDFNAPRNSDLVNRSKLDILSPGIFKGYDVVIGSGTIAAADTLEIESGASNTSVLMSKDGVKVTETGPDPIAQLLVTTADAVNPRIDIVVVQHTFTVNNDPATYAVIAGTPAGSPVPPATPADAVVLAEIHVAALAGSITNSNIIRRPKGFTSLNTPGRTRLDELNEANHVSVATIAALKAIEPDDRFDGQTIIVDATFTSSGTGGIYRFDASSSAAADDLVIVTPTNFATGTDGRWILVSYFNEGTYVASIGGITPSGDGTFDDVINRFENSSYRNAIIYFRDDLTYSGPDVAISKPIKFVGIAEPGVGLGADGPEFVFASKITFRGTPTTTSEGTLVEIDSMTFSRDTLADGTDRIIVEDGVTLRLRDALVTDASAGTATTPCWDFQAGALIDVENCLLNSANTSGEALFGLASNTRARIRMSRSLANQGASSGPVVLTAGTGNYIVEMTNHSLWKSDDLSLNPSFDLDGTSLVMGTSQVPAFTGAQQIRGENNYSLKFEDANWVVGSLHPELGEAIQWYSGVNLKIEPGTFTLQATPAQIVMIADRSIRGSGRFQTVINATLPGSGNSLFQHDVDRVEWRDFRINAIENGAVLSVFRWDSAGADCVFENIHVDVQGGGGLVFTSLRIDSATGPFLIRDVKVSGSSSGEFDTGMSIIGGLPTKTTIENVEIGANCWRDTGINLASCRASNVRVSMEGSGGAGVALGMSTSDCQVDNCLIDATGSGSAITGSVGFLVSSETLMNACRVIGIDSATKIIDKGMSVTGDENRIHDCVVRDCFGIGIDFAGTVDNCLVSGCWVRNCTTNGINETGTQNFIHGNYLKSNGGAQVTIAGTGSAGADNQVYA